MFPHRVYMILGCGYTGRRVAKRLVEGGRTVIATNRSGVINISGVDKRKLDLPGTDALGTLPERLVVLHSIPVLESGDPTPTLLELLGERIERVVYLSTTSVYGATVDVDEHTPAAPATESARLRFAAEHAVQAGPWSSLVLRPAAIYGPDRGVHVKMQRGEFRLPGDGSDYVSRIHVDDLAMLVTAALDSNLTGAYPVADDEPCTSADIATFCANLLHVEMPPRAATNRRANRRVDGSAIRRALGIELRYPTYREGIRAAVEG